MLVCISFPKLYAGFHVVVQQIRRSIYPYIHPYINPPQKKKKKKNDGCPDYSKPAKPTTYHVKLRTVTRDMETAKPRAWRSRSPLAALQVTHSQSDRLW